MTRVHRVIEAFEDRFYVTQVPPENTHIYSILRAHMILAATDLFPCDYILLIDLPLAIVPGDGVRIETNGITYSKFILNPSLYTDY
jgi:hypothetical protein